MRLIILVLGLLTVSAALASDVDRPRSSDPDGRPGIPLEKLGIPGYMPSRCEPVIPRGYLFVFATIADSHIRLERSDSPKYLKATSISREVLANYVADINDHMPRVDFVVHLGDITDFGLRREFDEAKVIMDRLQCRLYPVVGNHDNFQYDRKQAWKDFAGMDSTRYAFDHLGFHFIVIDCTADRYTRPFVACDSVMQDWVAGDLARNRDKPTIVFSHYNMWKRGWSARFDTTMYYAEYEGMADLRGILEASGNVVAVINGHVHANRVEVHNDIYYVDVAATIVGPPTIRYFYVFPDRIEVTYECISDCRLFSYTVSLCSHCPDCFSPEEVCAFIDGAEADKRFTIPVRAVALEDRADE